MPPAGCCELVMEWPLVKQLTEDMRLFLIYFLGLGLEVSLQKPRTAPEGTETPLAFRGLTADGTLTLRGASSMNILPLVISCQFSFPVLS